MRYLLVLVLCGCTVKVESKPEPRRPAQFREMPGYREGKR